MFDHHLKSHQQSPTIGLLAAIWPLCIQLVTPLMLTLAVMLKHYLNWFLNCHRHTKTCLYIIIQTAWNSTKKKNSTFFPGSLHVYHHVCWILSWLWFQDSLNISSLCVKMISGAAWQGKDVVYKEYVNVTDLCMKQERPKPSFLTCFIFHFSLWMRAVMWPKQKNWFWSPSGPLSSLLLWWQLN